MVGLGSKGAKLHEVPVLLGGSRPKVGEDPRVCLGFLAWEACCEGVDFKGGIVVHEQDRSNCGEVGHLWEVSVLPQGDEAVLGMLVMYENAEMGGCDSHHYSDGINCGANSCGDFVWAKVEAVVNHKAILEDDKGGGFV